MSKPPEMNQNSNDLRKELKILIIGDKPKNLLPEYSQAGAFAYSKKMSEALETISERAISQIIRDNPGKKIVLLSRLELGMEQAAARRAVEMGIEVKAFIPFKEHGKNWTGDFQKQYRELIGEIREKGGVVETSDKEYNPQRTQLRDYRMVDEAQLLVSLHNPEVSPAHQKTLDYAAKHSKATVNIWRDAEKILREVSKNTDGRNPQNSATVEHQPEKAALSEIENQATRKIEIRGRIAREDVRAERDKIFLFGDNLKQTGYGGQAREMRGETNTRGIPTKKAPDNRPESFFSDKEFEANKKAIDEAFGKIPVDKTIVIPQGGIGTGLAKMEEKAPQTFAYLNEKLAEIGFDNRRGKIIIIEPRNENKVVVQSSPEKPPTATRLLDLNNIQTSELQLLSPAPEEVRALENNRREALSDYADRLRRNYKANKNGLRDGMKNVSDALDKGEQITIACNCRAGMMCHADVVKMAVEKINLHVKNQQIQEANRVAKIEKQTAQPTAKPDLNKPDVKINQRTQRAIAEIVSISETDKLLEKISQTDGRNQSEQASHLGKFSQFVRDIYERGGAVTNGKLIVPKETQSLAPTLALTTQEYAVKRLGGILSDEAKAKELAPTLVEYGNKIAGSTADGETKLKVFGWMYDALEGKAAYSGRDAVERIGENKARKFDDALEKIGALAEQMHELEPADKIEFVPLNEFGEKGRTEAAWENADENRLVESIYEDAIARDAATGEAIEKGESLFEEQTAGERGWDADSSGRATSEAFDRIDLTDKAPQLPAEFTENELARLLAETLPEVDRRLESGAPVKDILQPFHENVRQSARIDALNRLEKIFQKQKIAELEAKLAGAPASAGQKEKLENEIARWQNLVLTPTGEDVREMLANREENNLKGKKTIAQASGKSGEIGQSVKDQIEKIDVRRLNVIELKTPGEYTLAHESAEKTFYRKTKTEIAALRLQLAETRENKETSDDKFRESAVKKELNDLLTSKPAFAFKLENSPEIVAGIPSAKAVEERSFVSAYVNFQLKQPETRLRHASERFRLYAARLEAATTRAEIIKTASQIRAENAAAGLKWKDSEKGEREKQPRPLSQKEMQFLFTETSPAHYTGEMTVAKLAYAHAGESRRQMTEALVKGEISPSPEAQKLVESLEARLERRNVKDSIAATKHFFESLKTPNDVLKIKNAFCQKEIYQSLPPQEKDFVYQLTTQQKENLEYRLAFEQRQLIKSGEISRDEIKHQPQPSETQKSFYHLSGFNQARALGERVETSPLVSKEISERDYRAAAIVLQNQPPEKIINLSRELKQSATHENRAIGEILETFARAEVVKTSGKTTVEIKLPENALVGMETYRELLEKFYPNDERENDKFKSSGFGEKTLEAARIKGQDETIKNWREELSSGFYAYDAPAAAFETERAVAESISQIVRLQESARATRSENWRILEKYASRARFKIQNQKLTAPTAEEQKQIVKAALDLSQSSFMMNATAKQFFEAAQKEITVTDFQKFAANEKLLAENKTLINRNFAEIAVKQTALEENRIKTAENGRGDKLHDVYLQTQKAEENRLLTLAARGVFEQETTRDLSGKSIGELVASADKEKIKNESAAFARIALEPELKDFAEKDYNEQALKLADAIEQAHELSQRDATPERIAEAFAVAENERDILFLKSGNSVEKSEIKPLSLRLYEAEIQRAEKRLLTERLGEKLASDKNFLENQKTFNLETIFSINEREQVKREASEIAKSRLEPKELDADHRKIPTEAGRQALTTFKQLERAANVFQFSNDSSKIREAFAKLDQEAATLNKFRQEYDKTEKLALLRDGVKTDLVDLLRKNQNLKEGEMTERVSEILRQNFARVELSGVIQSERQTEILSREITGKIEAKQNALTKETAGLNHRATQPAERNATHEKQLAMHAAKDQKTKEAFVLAR